MNKAKDLQSQGPIDLGDKFCQVTEGWYITAPMEQYLYISYIYFQQEDHDGPVLLT